MPHEQAARKAEKDKEAEATPAQWQPAAGAAVLMARGFAKRPRGVMECGAPPAVVRVVRPRRPRRNALLKSQNEQRLLSEVQHAALGSSDGSLSPSDFSIRDAAVCLAAKQGVGRRVFQQQNGPAGIVRIA